MKRYFLFFLIISAGCKQITIEDEYIIVGSGDYIYLSTSDLINPKSNFITYYDDHKNDWQIVGKYALKILLETSDNWFIGKKVYTEANIREFNGNWGGSFSSEEQLVIVDKHSGNAILAKLTDDVFNMLPDEAIPQVMNWDNNRLYFALPPYMFGELTAGINMKELIFPRSREAIEMINKIPAENNPVIFTFSLKDKFEIKN